MEMSDSEDELLFGSESTMPAELNNNSQVIPSVSSTQDTIQARIEAILTTLRMQARSQCPLQFSIFPVLSGPFVLSEVFSSSPGLCFRFPGETPHQSWRFSLLPLNLLSTCD